MGLPSRRFLFLLLIGCLANTSQPVKSQTGGTAFLYSPETSGFPQISVFLSLTDSLGGRPAGLTNDDLVVQEDQADVRDLILEEEQTGFRLIVIIDPGVDLLRMLPEGESRTERLQNSVAEWLGGFSQSGLDDLTLITPEGTAVLHTTDAAQFLNAIQSYKPVIPADPNPGTMLQRGLEAAADPLTHGGMRSFLLVFSAAAADVSTKLAPLVCPRALELRVPLYGIWSGRVQPSTRADINALAGLASACGGYSGALENSAGLATLFDKMATQRAQYRLAYRSVASVSGEHNLQVTVRRSEIVFETPPLAFSLDVQPPVVSWLSFPDPIVREGTDPQDPVEAYLPAAADFEVEVSFPDGHPRKISSIQLFADGNLVSECRTPPCSGIRWGLTGVSASGTFQLELAVHDELGMEGRTEARQLTIEVAYPSAWEVFRVKYLGPASIILALVLAGGLLTLAVAAMNGAGLWRNRTASITPDFLFPAAEGSYPAQSNLRRKQIRKREFGGEVEQSPSAALVTLEPADSRSPAIAIAAEDFILGRDVKAAPGVIDDPSVSSRHARIVKMQDGAPWIFDLGSTAGTWINFEEVPREGRALRDGDRLNLGRAAFRVRRPMRDPEEDSP